MLDAVLIQEGFVSLELFQKGFLVVSLSSSRGGRGNRDTIYLSLKTVRACAYI